ncbi:MAG: PHP domain-containing protein [Buchananella hordeovulneris]|nr:PHP domain-containing protein [Buchananella hordeovulneris]
MRIDLHTHTNCSDGTDTPTELMHAAARVGLDVIGLTDHDTTAGWAEAAACVQDTGVALVRGTEISCTHDGIPVHLLAYLQDPADPSLTEIFAATRASREGRAQKMVELIAVDYPLTWEQVQAHVGKDASVGRPHIADALVSAGFFLNRDACFERILHPHGPYYVRHYSPHPVEAVQLVRAAGGVPVMAHPRAQARGRIVPSDVITDMARAGLFGLEAHHRDHTPLARRQVEEMAAELGLEITGASDYHGTGKPNRLGENLTDAAVLARLEEQGTMEVVRPCWSST